jgi:large subunit ribosomal protein L32
MAVPKKKMSRSRTRRRKATWRLRRTSTQRCPQCDAPKAPHRACPQCGSYKGREVLTDR